jgi:hypothetical protein
MEHDPLRDRHDGLLCLIQSGQLGLDGIVGIRHDDEDLRIHKAEVLSSVLALDVDASCVCDEHVTRG